MHRSASLSRTSEEFFIHAASSSSKNSLDTSELPVYDPNSDVGKKEKLRIKFAENAVHIIPVVLVLCAVILWCFSSTEVEMVSKDRSIVSKIDGLTIDGDIDVHDKEVHTYNSYEPTEDLVSDRYFGVIWSKRRRNRAFGARSAKAPIHCKHIGSTVEDKGQAIAHD
ncbi:hypothetical protein C5167_049945 [Papaver somniferum]|uniref:Transmembrane protein n=1 Tax=Papaver somniferum TaxID=3469 RepID=A0A4Y7KPZ5_PAPSO|nr:hypothetical protein C5167_049945 [Papaver somniferum]